MSKIFALIILLLAVTPAYAQDLGDSSLSAPDKSLASQDQGQGEPMRIEVDDETMEAEDAYVEAVDKLTPVQQTELAGLDKAFVKTMAPIMDLYELGGKVLFCINSDAFPAAQRSEYVQSFKDFQQIKTIEQEKLWVAHRKQAAEIGYIDHALMDGHYAYIQAIQKAAAEQMVEKAGKEGVYNGTNCPEIQKTLDFAHKSAPNALK
ncbi:MAG TPA: hypothetical protein VEF76_12135 [Patescibacteria group bacterium]|nr:hypothetical protein [Patescibacteria group bacterium]